MPAFDPQAYGPVIAELLREPRLMDLGPGQPNQAVAAKLQALANDPLDPNRGPVRDAGMAAACRAALWLYHDFLDESHAISQDIDTPTGSYWHGIVHRREPDFANARYWFRKVGHHPIFGNLGAAAAAITRQTTLDESTAFLASQPSWNPFGFAVLCEACLGGKSPRQTLCQHIQQREWEILFDYCYRQAFGLSG